MVVKIGGQCHVICTAEVLTSSHPWPHAGIVEMYNLN